MASQRERGLIWAVEGRQNLERQEKPGKEVACAEAVGVGVGVGRRRRDLTLK